MIRSYLITVLILFGVFGLWVLVTHAARLLAHRHPEFGEAREEGGQCGVSCGCKRKAFCPNRTSGEKSSESSSIYKEVSP